MADMLREQAARKSGRQPVDTTSQRTREQYQRGFWREAEVGLECCWYAVTGRHCGEPTKVTNLVNCFFGLLRGDDGIEVFPNTIHCSTSSKAGDAINERKQSKDDGETDNVNELSIKSHY